MLSGSFEGSRVEDEGMIVGRCGGVVTKFFPKGRARVTWRREAL